LKAIVSDTSVLIDLERGTFLESMFSLPFEFVVPDLLFDRELKNHNGCALIESGLHIQELDRANLALAMDYYRKYRNSFSIPDVFAYVLAKTNSWILLSGDGALRKLAAEENVKCHGVLWLLDQLHLHRIIDNDRLYKGLHKTAKHPRCRLPQIEIQKRLNFCLPLHMTKYCRSAPVLSATCF